MNICIIKVTQKFLKIYTLDFNCVGKRITQLFISTNFYAADGSVGEKLEQGKKNNKCAIAVGMEGQV